MKHFLNDKDGLSARDYLLIVSTTIFFLFVVIGLIMVLMDRVMDGMYLSLLDMVAPVVMTIVGSVAGVDITDKITKRRERNTEENKQDSNENEFEDYEGRV